jgi:UDP-N-acetyl-D-mannosaminuronic acid dehydrogenase
VGDADTVLVIIGTPVDEFMNPSINDLARCIDQIGPHLRSNQLLVLQSTVYPGTTEWTRNRLVEHSVECLVAFCPERVVQGLAVNELRSVPQIVSGATPAAEAAAIALFGQINPDLVQLSPSEAELVKLCTNAYRYIEFAIANQFYMLATEAGVDYYRVRHGMTYHYPRMGRIPLAGFAAGPCLYKDTVQLGAFSNSGFALGSSAVLTNEGFPLWVVERIAREHDLSRKVIGILGAAFKSESDDARSSLSYKLRKILLFRSKNVLMTDPYVIDERLVPLGQVLEQSDILVLATPHKAYRDLDLSGKIVVDVWDFYKQGAFMTGPAASGPTAS